MNPAFDARNDAARRCSPLPQATRPATRPNLTPLCVAFGLAAVLSLLPCVAGAQARGGGGGGSMGGGGGGAGMATRSGIAGAGPSTGERGGFPDASANGSGGLGDAAQRSGDGRDARSWPSADSRSQRVDRLLRDNPGRVERDPGGAPVLSGEVIVLLPFATALPDALPANGFRLLREEEILGSRVVVLRSPSGMALSRAVELARRLAPAAEIDFNHVHLGSGAADASVAASSVAAPDKPTSAVLRVGLIDEALMPTPELQSTTVAVRPCDGQAPVLGHGTVVASVLVRTVHRLGRTPHLYAADLACGAGAVDGIASALAWMAAEQVPVVNLSVVGPRNRVLEVIVASFLARGHVLVAAVGNDGPAAAALYPAAYPGVVAVTAVDDRARVLVEAGRGDHVAFAASGIVDVDLGASRAHRWRGTSFAAPVVAAALAARLDAPDPRAAADAVADLARTAFDLGEPGRDAVYGYGLIAPATSNVARTP